MGRANGSRPPGSADAGQHVTQGPTTFHPRVPDDQRGRNVIQPRHDHGRTAHDGDHRARTGGDGGRDQPLVVAAEPQVTAGRLRGRTSRRAGCRRRQAPPRRRVVDRSGLCGLHRPVGCHGSRVSRPVRGRRRRREHGHHRLAGPDVDELALVGLGAARPPPRHRSAPSATRASVASWTTSADGNAPRTPSSRVDTSGG